MKMADKTFGVKVSEELYDRVKGMIENSGDNAKDWFEKAVSMAALQSIKQGATDYNQDLNELEVHTTRIYELISNMIQRSVYIKDNAVKEVADKLEQREAIIGEYQEKANTALEELKLTKVSLEGLGQEKEELTKQLDSQMATLKNNQSLINEYKEKIDTLSSLVNQYKGYADENTKLKETFATEKAALAVDFQQKEDRYVSAIEEMKTTAADQRSSIEKLTEKLNSTIAANEKEMDSLKVNLGNQLTQLTNQKDLEKERAVLEVERKFQDKLQEVHDQYNEKLAALYAKFEAGNPKKRGNNKQEDK